MKPLMINDLEVLSDATSHFKKVQIHYKRRLENMELHRRSFFTLLETRFPTSYVDKRIGPLALAWVLAAPFYLCFVSIFAGKCL